MMARGQPSSGLATTLLKRRAFAPPAADGMGRAIAIDRARQFILGGEHRSANRPNKGPPEPVESINFAEVFPSCPLPSVLSF